MARTCDICGKGNQRGHNVSHANNKTHKLWSANLQRVKAVEKGTVKHIRACTRCIRSNLVVKAG
jgi:large subunit ribosomal protein L28